MDDDPPNTNRIGSMGDTAGRIAKQSTAQAASLIATIHREARQYRNGNGSGMFLRNRPGTATCAMAPEARA